MCVFNQLINTYIWYTPTFNANSAADKIRWSMEIIYLTAKCVPSTHRNYVSGCRLARMVQVPRAYVTPECMHTSHAARITVRITPSLCIHCVVCIWHAAYGSTYSVHAVAVDGCCRSNSECNPHRVRSACKLGQHSHGRASYPA